MQIKYFVEWYLSDKDRTSYLKGLRYLSMKSSILSLYPVASMTIQLDSSFIESGELALGSTSKFVFVKEGDNKRIEREYKVWKIEQSAPESARSMNGFYTITLLHPWYFRQFNVSKAYYGTSWSVIAECLLENNSTDFYGFYLDKSEDGLGKFYRTYQTQGNFIETRVKDLYLVDDSPVFIYVNDKKEFHAHSFNNIINSTNLNVAVDTRRISLAQDRMTKLKSSDRLFQPISFNYKLNTSGNMWNMFRSKSTILYRSSHEVRSPSGLTSEEYSTFGKGFFPISNSLKNMDKPLAVYIDDSENQTYAVYSGLLQKQSAFLMDQQFTITGMANFTIQVGEPVELYLKKSEDSSEKEADTNSVFNAKYAIMTMEHFYQDANMITTMTLSRGLVTPMSGTVPSDTVGFTS